MSAEKGPLAIFATSASSWEEGRLVRRVDPFEVPGDPADVFAHLKGLLLGLPRTVIVEETEDRLHALCRTLLGFKDDIEFHFCPEDRLIHVRSASRFSGFTDLGVNWRRVEGLRRRLHGK